MLHLAKIAMPEFSHTLRALSAWATRRLMLVMMLALTLGLAACKPPTSAGGCPDLTGTWALWPEPNEESAPLALLLPILDSMWAQAGRPELAQAGWERVSISGDADRALTFTFWRPAVGQEEWMQQASAYALAHGQSQAARQARTHRQSLEQAERMQEFGPGAAPAPAPGVAPPPSPSARWLDVVRAEFSLKNGTHYSCLGGQMQGNWLKTGWQGPHAGLVPPGWQAQPVRLSRPSAGRLVAQLPLRQTHELIVWCGDGCKGIPYWVSKSELEDAWPARPPPSPQARVRVLNLTP